MNHIWILWVHSNNLHPSLICRGETEKKRRCNRGNVATVAKQVVNPMHDITWDGRWEGSLNTMHDISWNYPMKTPTYPWNIRQTLNHLFKKEILSYLHFEVPGVCSSGLVGIVL